MNIQEVQLRSMLGQPIKMKARLLIVGLLFSLGWCISLSGQKIFGGVPPEPIDPLVQPDHYLDEATQHQSGQDDQFVSPFTEHYTDLDPCVECEWDHRQYPTGELSGFLQFDSAAFNESAATRAAFGVINDKTAVRRARLALIGDLRTNVGYKLDVDFAAANHPSARDVFIDFKERPFADRLVLGNTKVPFQLEALTSSKDFTFVERAPFFTFTPFRQVGIWADGTFVDEQGTWSLAGFRVGQGGLVLNHAEDGQGVALRTTILPWYEDNGRYLLHTGFNYSYLQPFNKSVRYDAKLSFFSNQEPGINSPGVPILVDTGTIPAQGVNLFNYELAGTLGSLNYQSEMTYALVDQIGGPPLMFYGGYSQIGWFLTGETRPYNRKTGVFDTLEPNEGFFDGGWGAWEVAVRGTYLNLNDKNIQGGRLNSIEFAVNWFLSKSISLKFNCVRGYIENSTTAGNVDLNICGGRLQIIY
ncbi:OprO/OprP family phosphate-selective porin [Gimesia aquarii]|uniref:Porin O n=1 Tax=Gimesia aquarii TaxID=2527964 RepID=A0A517VSJ8_9PLAN|nr:porin [Gimesia aquarii]QDT95985.1 Porin O precursor [Gimesia aquarii]